MKFNEILSLEDQEKVLLTILSMPNFGQETTLTKALDAGCTVTAPVAAVMVCNEIILKQCVRHISNWTAEALEIFRKSGNEVWRLSANGLHKRATNPYLAFALRGQEALDYFCKNEMWHDIKRLRDYYAIRMEENGENSADANLYHLVLCYVDYYATEEIRYRFGL